MKKLLLLIFLAGAVLPGYSQITGGSNPNEPTPQTENASNIAPISQIGVSESNGSLGNAYSLGTVRCPNGLVWTQNISYGATLTGGDNYPFLDGVPYGQGWNMSLPCLTLKYFIKQKYTDDAKRILFENYETHAPVNSYEYGMNMTPAEARTDGDVVGYYPEISIPGKGKFLLTHKIDNIYVPLKFDEYFEVTHITVGNTWKAEFADGTTYVFKEIQYTTVNPTDLRQAPDDIETQSDLYNSVAPRYLPTKWYVTEIYRKTDEFIQHKILFEYKRYGAFNRHKSVDYQLHQNSADQGGDDTYCNYEVSYSDVDPSYLSADILLQNIYAVYLSKDEQKIENQIILEKLEFNYEEDESLHQPGILNATQTDGGRNVEVFDEMYYRSEIYGARQFNTNTQQFEINDFIRYHHRYNIDQSEDITKSSITNPYLYDGEYQRSAASGIDGIGFNHCFLETPRITFSSNPMAINYMPAGDQYEVSTGLTAQNSNYNYCTFDINVIGSKGTDIYIPEGETPEYCPEEDYNDVRGKKIYSTFNSMAKWNIYSFNNTTRTSVQTSNFFTLSSGHTDLDGIYIQVGPGAADMDYSRPLLGSSSILDISKNTYTLDFLDNRIGRSRYWMYPHFVNAGQNLYNQTLMERINHPVSQNFGVGYPFFNIHQIIDPLYSPGNTCYNDLNWSSTSYGSIYKPLSSIGTLYSSTSGHTIDEYRYPTLSKSISLTDIKVYRYSKTTYVLKNVKHWVAYSEDDQLCDGQDFVLKGEYTLDYETAPLDIKEHRFYQFTELPSNSSGIQSKGTRYVVLLKRINQKDITTTESYITTAYNYELLEKVQSQAKSITWTTSAGNETLFYFDNYGIGYALNKITNALGLITEINYSSSYVPFSYTENVYQNYFYKDKGETYTQLEFFANEVPPSFGAMYIPTVHQIVVEDEKGGQMFTTYSYGPSYVKELPWVPGRTETDRSNMNAKPLSGKMEMHESWGFKNTEVKVTYLAQGTGSPTYYSKTKFEFFDDTEWPKTGKIKKKEVFGKADQFNPEIVTTYDYTAIKAFENGRKRMEISVSYPLPNYYNALPRAMYDYADQHNGELDINDVGANFNMENNWIDLHSTPWFIGEGTVIPSTMPISVDFYITGNAGTNYYTRNIVIAESDIDEVTLINSNHSWLLDVYFVALKSETQTLYKDGKALTNIKEYDYFAASYDGVAVGEGWKYVMEHLAGSSNPIKLYFEPSWQLYSITSYSPSMPDVKNRQEYFYYYDLKNRYGAFAPEILTDETFYDRVITSMANSNNAIFKGCLPFVNNGLEGLANASLYGIRTPVYEQRSGIINPTGDNPNGKYHSDYSLWNEFSRQFESIASTVVDENEYCTPPPPPEEETPEDCYKFYYGQWVGPKSEQFVVYGLEDNVTEADLVRTNQYTKFYHPTMGWQDGMVLVKKKCKHLFIVNIGGIEKWLLPTLKTTGPLAMKPMVKGTILDPTNGWNDGGASRDVGLFLEVKLNEVTFETGGILSQYVRLNAENIKTGVFNNYDANNLRHVEVGEFVLDALTVIGDYLDFYDLDFETFKNNRTSTEIVQIAFQGIAFSPETGAINDITDPIEDEISYINVEYPCMSNLMRFDFLSFKSPYYNVEIVASQIDETVLEPYSNSYSYYSIESFPPILKWELKPNLNVNCFEDPNLDPSTFTTYNDFYFFEEVFPYDTMNSSIVHGYNIHDQATSIENERGLHTNSENYQIQLTYYRGTAHGEIMKTVLNMGHFGYLKASFVNDGLSNIRQTDYTYTQTNLTNRINQRKGIGYTAPSTYSQMGYDGFNRVIQVSNNEGVLQQYEYSNWHTRDIYTGGSAKSVSDDFGQKMLSNYLNTTDYFNNNDRIYSRTYVDPLGRQTLTATQGYKNSNYADWVFKSGFAEYDDLGNVRKQFKPTAALGVSGQDLSFGSPGTLSAGLYIESIPDYNAIPSQVETIPYGRMSGTYTQLTNSYLIDHNQFQSETGAIVGVMDDLFPQRSSITYLIFKQVATNEDGETATSYTDAAGRLIASLSTPDGSTNALTVSKFDLWGRLEKVINPLGQEISFVYNHLGHIIIESHPDKGETRKMYDRSGNVVLYQDANMRPDPADHSYRYMEYDMFGRLINSSIRLLDLPNGLNCPSPEICTGLSPLGYEEIDYQNNSMQDFHLANTSLLSYSWKYAIDYGSGQYYNIDDFLGPETFESKYYYDAIPTVINSTGTTEEFTNVHPLLLGTFGTSLRVLEDVIARSGANYNLDKLSAIKVFDPNGAVVMYKFFGYDLMGRMTDEIQQFDPNSIRTGNGLTGKGRIYRIEYGNFDLKGRPQETSQYYQFSDSHEEELWKRKSYTYLYDELGRVETMFLNTFAAGSLPKTEKMATYIYDKATGLLIDKKYYAQYQAGCEKEIEHIQLDVLSDNQNRLASIQSKFFNWYLFYDAQELSSDPYIASLSLPGALPGNSQNYSGRINATMAEYNFGSNSSVLKNYPDLGGDFEEPTLFGFQYDEMGRLTQVNSNVYDYGTTLPFLGDEAFVYDLIGNFVTIHRYKAWDAVNLTYNEDKFDFNYVTGTNRLNSVSEIGNSSKLLRYFSYDQNGNVLSDNGDIPSGNHKAVTNAQYYLMNHPHSIEVNGLDETYLYNENGIRIFKKSIGVEPLQEEFYFVSNSGAMYSIEETGFDNSGNGNGSISRYIIPDVGYQDNSNLIHYLINDHLGNLRLSYTINWCSTCGSVCDDQHVEYRIEYVAEYLAYGGVLREFIRPSTEQEKFLTTGNERDKLTGWDYRNARYYDADLGRFLSVDKLNNAALNWSSYRYAFNNPISYIDPSGLFEGWVEVDGGIAFDENINSSEDLKQAQKEGNYKGGRYIGQHNYYVVNGVQWLLTYDGRALSSEGAFWQYLPEAIVDGNRNSRGSGHQVLANGIEVSTGPKLPSTLSLNRRFGIFLEETMSPLERYGREVNGAGTLDAIIQAGSGLGEAIVGIGTENPWYFVDGSTRFAFNTFKAGCYLTLNDNTANAAPTNLGGFIGKMADGANGVHWSQVGTYQSMGTMFNDGVTFVSTLGLVGAGATGQYVNVLGNAYTINTYIWNPPIPTTK